MVQNGIQSSLAQQRYGGLKSDEVAQLGHVDAIAVGVTNLRRRTHDHNALGFKAVQHTQDALLQGGSAHNAVVEGHNAVFGPHNAVGGIVDVRHHVVAAAVLRDEGAQLDVLPGDFFYARTGCHGQLNVFGSDGAAFANEQGGLLSL